MEPFDDLIRLLRPTATRWRRIESGGRWALSFEARNDVLFAVVERGDCILRTGAKRLRLGAGDLVLVRTSKPVSLASKDAPARATSSDLAFAGKAAIRLGQGREVTLQGGRFLFDTANEQLLTGLLPPVVHVRAAESSRVRLLLQMNAEETARGGPGAGLFVARSMELVLIDLLRTVRVSNTGLLAGLADPVAGPALRAVHADIKRPWTLLELAKRAAVSRSTFAAHFRRILGVPAMRYILDWRIALAKDELTRGAQPLSEIAYAIGFQSTSAFSTAFRKAMGQPPGAYRRLSR